MMGRFGLWSARLASAGLMVGACGGITEHHDRNGAGGTSSGAEDADVGLDGSWDGPSQTDSTLDAGEQDAGDGHVEPSCPVIAPGGIAPKCAVAGVKCGCGLDCCDQRFIPGGSFMMGRSLNGTDAYPLGLDFELPEHQANVSDFYLDTFEVTVARFRPFVLGYPGTIPKDGDGAHPKKSGTGWQSAWTAAFAALPATRAELETQLTCPGEYPDILEPTYTAQPGPKDALPINCVNWYQAFAFCVWEGGRLPTEAEWEYAAAGGAENRLYPWGAEPPDWPFFKRSCLHSSCIGKYGTVAGASRWGNFDLAGSLMEIVLDTPAAYSPDPCTDCIVYDPTKFGKDSQVITARGGHYGSGDSALRAAWRAWPLGLPWMWSVGLGFRCARSP